MGHWVLSKMSMKIFCPCQKVLDIWSVQNVHKTSGPQQKVLDICRTIWSMPKSPWYLATFCPFQNDHGDIWSMPKGPWYLVLSKTIWHEPNMLMDLDRTKFQGPFCMNWMSWMLWTGPNVCKLTLRLYYKPIVIKMVWCWDKGNEIKKKKKKSTGIDSHIYA